MRLLEYRLGYGLAALIFVASILGAVWSLNFKSVSQWFPLFIGTAGGVLSALVIVVDVLGDRRARAADANNTDDESDGGEETPRAILMQFGGYLLWFAGFIALLLMVGMPLAVAIWTFLFIRFAGRESLVRSAVSSLVLSALLVALAGVLGLGLPEGLLFDSGEIIPRNWRL